MYHFKATTTELSFNLPASGLAFLGASYGGQTADLGLEESRVGKAFDVPSLKGKTIWKDKDPGLVPAKWEIEVMLTCQKSAIWASSIILGYLPLVLPWYFGLAL